MRCKKSLLINSPQRIFLIVESELYKAWHIHRTEFITAIKMNELALKCINTDNSENDLLSENSYISKHQENFCES